MNIHPKVVASALAGAVVTILMWVLTFAHITAPPEVAAAATVVVSTVLGYLVPGPQA